MSDTSRLDTPSKQNATADVGFSLSLKLPWRGEASRQTGDAESEAIEENDAGPAGPVSSRFLNSLRTVDLWKAQHTVRDTSPVPRLPAHAPISGNGAFADPPADERIFSLQAPVTLQQVQEDGASKGEQTPDNIFVGITNIFANLTNSEGESTEKDTTKDSHVPTG